MLIKMFMNQISVFESQEITTFGIFNINLNLVISIIVLIVSGLVTLIQLKEHPFVLKIVECLRYIMAMSTTSNDIEVRLQEGPIEVENAYKSATRDTDIRQSDDGQRSLKLVLTVRFHQLTSRKRDETPSYDLDSLASFISYVENVRIPVV
ncbi:Gustatory receptor [Aphis craccivora]|uniref:Gustatory receptor n=1 Tax=Aphis craccivora TaxID=307492 RepID=A0A6G0ZR06_APHCR|nr:Gustatory receptor [Aphis craccivora]